MVQRKACHCHWFGCHEGMKMKRSEEGQLYVVGYATIAWCGGVCWLDASME